MTNARVGDQNLYGPGPSVRNVYEEGNMNTRVGDQNLYDPGFSVRYIHVESNINARVGDQNLHGPRPSVRNYCEQNNLRPIAMPLGRNEVIVNPVGSSLTIASSDINFQGQVDGQNLHGR